jgi:hypothetical protein
VVEDGENATKQLKLTVSSKRIMNSVSFRLERLLQSRLSLVGWNNYVERNQMKSSADGQYRQLKVQQPNLYGIGQVDQAAVSSFQIEKDRARNKR